MWAAGRLMPKTAPKQILQVAAAANKAIELQKWTAAAGRKGEPDRALLKKGPWLAPLGQLLNRRTRECCAADKAPWTAHMSNAARAAILGAFP